jgi:hypothetical protein
MFSPEKNSAERGRATLRVMLLTRLELMERDMCEALPKEVEPKIRALFVDLRQMINDAL